MDNLFTITHQLYITGRGFVVGGRIKQGTFHVGDEIQIWRNGTFISPGKIEGIEFLNFGSRSDRNDNIAFLLTGFGEAETVPGDTIRCIK